MTGICNHFEKICEDSVLNLPNTKSSQYVFLEKDLLEVFEFSISSDKGSYFKGF